jgi:hypothetical protein
MGRMRALAGRGRWLVPLAAAGLVAALTVSPGLAGPGGRPTLPATDTLTLLGKLTHPHVPGIEGTLTVTADLGLPALPSGDLGGLPLTGLLQGSNAVQLWVGPHAQLRIAVLGQLSEQDLIRTRTALWLYSSVGNTVRRLSGGAGPSRSPAPTPRRSGTAAGRVLSRLIGGVRLSGALPVWVAGQRCYQLVLRPTRGDTTVSRVQIAVDAANGVPLRIEVFGTDHSVAALSVAFDDVTFARPPAALLRFRPPPGARSAAAHPRAHPRARRPPGASRPGVRPATHRRTRVFLGDGWDAVLALPLQGVGGGVGGLVRELSGGSVLRTTLLTALVSRGELFVGAVRPARLERLAREAG